MSRMNDVGGMVGFPAVVQEPDEPPFHSDWEAHVFALNGALIRRGVYNLDEFRDAIERMPAQEYLAASYYERWFAAITTLLQVVAFLILDLLTPGRLGAMLMQVPFHPASLVNAAATLAVSAIIVASIWP